MGAPWSFWPACASCSTLVRAGKGLVPGCGRRSVLIRPPVVLLWLSSVKHFADDAKGIKFLIGRFRSWRGIFCFSF
jgi:hypothetical protein